MAALIPGATFAQVAITEAMYDLHTGSDSGREWIEIFNGGSTPVPLTKWKLFENGTNHKITAATGADTLAPNSYAVIADNATKFKTDWPAYAGQLFDSAFSLSNEGETVVLRNASSTDISSLTYTGADGGGGDGNSLNRDQNGGSMIARAPSPGAIMSTNAIPPPAPKVVPAPKTKTKAVAQKTTSRSTEEAFTPTAETSSDIPEPQTVNAETQTAAVTSVSTSSNGSYLWWAAAAALALLAAGALVASKHFGKREWNIIEEKGE